MASTSFDLTEWKANFLDLLISWQAKEVEFQVKVYYFELFYFYMQIIIVLIS